MLGKPTHNPALGLGRYLLVLLHPLSQGELSSIVPANLPNAASSQVQGGFSCFYALRDDSPKPKSLGSPLLCCPGEVQGILS